MKTYMQIQSMSSEEIEEREMLRNMKRNATQLNLDLGATLTEIEDTEQELFIQRKKKVWDYSEINRLKVELISLKNGMDLLKEEIKFYPESKAMFSFTLSEKPEK